MDIFTIGMIKSIVKRILAGDASFTGSTLTIAKGKPDEVSVTSDDFKQILELLDEHQIDEKVFVLFG